MFESMDSASRKRFAAILFPTIAEGKGGEEKYNGDKMSVNTASEAMTDIKVFRIELRPFKFCRTSSQSLSRDSISRRNK